MLEIRSILFPTDFSEGSEAALAYAVGFAVHHGAKLTILHVGNFVHAGAGDVNSLRDVYHQVRLHQHRGVEHELDALVERLGREHPELTVSREHRNGSPHMTICRVAQELDVDLVIMGTSSVSGLSQLLSGSTAERVIRQCVAPVLTVRAPEKG